MKKYIIGALLSLGLIAGTYGIVVATAPTTKAIPGNECSYVPEKFKHFNFARACARHDVCYGQRTQSRLACDRQFKADMLAVCSNISVGYTRCKLAANTYYSGVRMFGSALYERKPGSVINRMHQLYVKYLERA